MKQRKKLSVLWLFVVIPLFAFSQEEAGVKQDRISSKASIEVGVSGGINDSRQSLSPWGRHYRGEYGHAIGFHAQANYITSKRDTWGLRFSMHGMQGDYRLESGERSSEDVVLYYVAPQYGYMVPMFSRMTFSLIVGVGYLLYQNEGLLEATSFKAMSHQLGANAGLALDWKLSKHTALGCQYSVLTSLYGQRNQRRTMNGESNTISMDKWNALQISQMDLSLYLRVYL